MQTGCIKLPGARQAIQPYGSRYLLPLHFCRVRFLCFGVNIAQANPVLPGYSRTIFILRGKDGRSALAPAELALDWAPWRRDRARFALQLVPLNKVATNAESCRLTEKDVFQCRQHVLGRQNTQ